MVSKTDVAYAQLRVLAGCTRCLQADLCWWLDSSTILDLTKRAGSAPSTARRTGNVTETFIVLISMHLVAERYRIRVCAV